MKHIVILVFLLSLSCAYSFNHRFVKVQNSSDIYIAVQNEYFIKVDDSTIEITRNDNFFFKEQFKGINTINSSNPVQFSLKYYYDTDKIFEAKFFNKLVLKDTSNNIIAEIELSNTSLNINYKDFKKTINLVTANNFQSKKSLKILWSAFYGGSSNDSFVKIDRNRNDELLVAGVSSSNFINNKYPILPYSGLDDFIILKTDKDGDLKWLTMIGGSSNDYLYSMVLDRENNAWISGETRSSNFFIKNPISYYYAGGTADGAISKIDNEGNVIFSSYFGGNAYDAFADIAYNSLTNQIWLTGRTTSSNFLTTYNAEKSNRYSSYDSPIVGISTDGTLIYSSLFGSNGSDELTLGDCIEIDKNGEIVIVGYSNASYLSFGSNNKVGLSNKGSYDSFISKFDSNGKLKWSRFFGGSSVDYGNCLAIDSSNNILLNTTTKSANMECKNSNLKIFNSGRMDNHFAKFDESGNLIWSGYIGGSNDEGADYNAFQLIRADIDVAINGVYYFTFFTNSNNLITDDSSAYRSYNGGTDIYFMIMDENSNLNYSTYLGGSNNEKLGDILIWDDKVYLVGFSGSSDFPIVNRDSYQYNGLNDGVIVCFSNIVKTVDKTPPSITSQSTDDCGNIIEYLIIDENNPYGYKNINIIKNDNCSVVTVVKDRILKITISKNTLDKKANYKIEITNQADKKLIIEDSLLSNAANLLRTEPKSLLDLGRVSVFDNRFCQNIKIFNDSESDFLLTDAYFKNYKYFSFSLSQIPVHIKAKSSIDFSICVSPQDMRKSLINDTLVLFGDCYFKELPVLVEYFIPNLASDSKCDVSLELIADSTNFFNYQSILSHSNELLIETNNNSNPRIDFFDIFSAKVFQVDISHHQNVVKIDFNNLANGTYFIYIKEEKSINVIQLYLMR